MLILHIKKRNNSEIKAAILGLTKETFWCKENILFFSKLGHEMLAALA